MKKTFKNLILQKVGAVFAFLVHQVIQSKFNAAVYATQAFTWRQQKNL